MSDFALEAMPDPPATCPPRRHGRRWMLMVIGLLLLAGGVHWATKTERDPRLVGDWYSPSGTMLRFYPDGRFQRFMLTKNGLAPWIMQQWQTQGNEIHIRSSTGSWKRRWDDFLSSVRRSNVQVIRLGGDTYRILELSDETMKLRRIPRNASMRDTLM